MTANDLFLFDMTVTEKYHTLTEDRDHRSTPKHTHTMRKLTSCPATCIYIFNDLPILLIPAKYRTTEKCLPENRRNRSCTQSLSLSLSLSLSHTHTHTHTHTHITNDEVFLESLYGNNAQHIFVYTLLYVDLLLPVGISEINSVKPINIFPSKCSHLHAPIR
jgi:hypothetical protein